MSRGGFTGPQRIKAEVKRVPEFQEEGLQVPTSSGTGRGHMGLKGVTVAEYFSHLFSKITPHYWSLRLPCNILCLLFFCNCIFVCIYIDDIMGIDIWFRGRMEKGSSVTNYLQTRT